MKTLQTQGIILARTNFGEADRILTMLTPNYGKLRLTARGVRKVKSKLAGGIELFSVSEISFIQGKGEIGTLVSTRLVHHYENIVKDLNRTMLGYDLIKKLNRATEDEPEPEYFELLNQAFEALDDLTIDGELIAQWFAAQLLKLAGHSPNLSTDTSGQKLEADKTYNFSFDDMAFAPGPQGRFKAAHIKLLRLMFGGANPRTLHKIEGGSQLIKDTTPLVQSMSTTYIHM